MTLDKKEQRNLNNRLMSSFKKRDLIKFNDLISQGAVFNNQKAFEMLIEANDSSVFQTSFIQEVFNRYPVISFSNSSSHTSAFSYIFLFSIERNYDHIVDYALTHWINDFSEETLIQAFSSACYHCHLPILKKIILSGVDVNTNNGEALFRSVERHRMDVFNYLLELPVDVNMNNYNALQMACCNFNHEAFYILFRLCDDVHFDNDYLLSLAISETNHEVIPFLLNHVDLTSEQHQDCTFLIQAFENDDINSLAIFQLLLPCYPDLTSFNQHLKEQQFIKDSIEYNNNSMNSIDQFNHYSSNLLPITFSRDYIEQVAEAYPVLKSKLDFYEQFLNAYYFSQHLDGELNKEKKPYYPQQLELFPIDNISDNISTIINLTSHKTSKKNKI